MFGRVRDTPQDESTPFHPRTPYGIAKLFAHWATVNYREAYGIFACSGLLFNHESPLRGPEYVTRKIALAFTRIRHGLQGPVELGNLDAGRDWGFAGDYVKGMWQMLQHDHPDDYVLATNETHPIRSFAEIAAETLGWKMAWRGKGIEEVGFDEKSGLILVKINPIYHRPAEVDALRGNPAKAEGILGWRRHMDFRTLVTIMVETDDRRASIAKSHP
jgi:GDPmannose 4,6-dehydratase